MHRAPHRDDSPRHSFPPPVIPLRHPHPSRSIATLPSSTSRRIPIRHKPRRLPSAQQSASHLGDCPTPYAAFLAAPHRLRMPSPPEPSRLPVPRNALPSDPCRLPGPSLARSSLLRPPPADSPLQPFPALACRLLTTTRRDSVLPATIRLFVPSHRVTAPYVPSQPPPTYPTHAAHPDPRRQPSPGPAHHSPTAPARTDSPHRPEPLPTRTDLPSRAHTAHPRPHRQPSSCLTRSPRPIPTTRRAPRPPATSHPAPTPADDPSRHRPHAPTPTTNRPHPPPRATVPPYPQRQAQPSPERPPPHRLATTTRRTP